VVVVVMVYIYKPCCHDWVQPPQPQPPPSPKPSPPSRYYTFSRESIQAVITAAAAAETHQASEELNLKAKKEKLLCKLVGAVVVKYMSKYAKAMDHDLFKIHAKKVCLCICNQYELIFLTVNSAYLGHCAEGEENVKLH